MSEDLFRRVSCEDNLEHILRLNLSVTDENSRHIKVFLHFFLYSLKFYFFSKYISARLLNSHMERWKSSIGIMHRKIVIRALSRYSPCLRHHPLRSQSSFLNITKSHNRPRKSAETFLQVLKLNISLKIKVWLYNWIDNGQVLFNIYFNCFIVYRKSGSS